MCCKLDAQPSCAGSWGSPGFTDPGLWDTRLTNRGEAQATKLNRELLSSGWSTELLISSPLTRALQTSMRVFDGVPVQRRTVSPLCAERLFLSSDVGRSPLELREDFPAFDFPATLEPTWWYTPAEGEPQPPEWRPAGKFCCPGEPEEVFHARLNAFKELLGCMPESKITIVAHWGVIHALTGKSLENCQTVTCCLSELPTRLFTLQDAVDGGDEA